jgi:GAF domain-containing protein
VDQTARHLRLLTETIAVVNSTLDLEEVLSLVARQVAEALGADACFVYLYDEHGGRARAAGDARHARSRR